MKKLCLIFMLLGAPIWVTTSYSANQLSSLYTHLAFGLIWVEAINETPFWYSTWAYVIYVVLLLALLVSGYFYLLRKERQKIHLLQKDMESDKNKQINDMKLRFLTNFGHELNIPLSLIISPLELLVKEYESDTALVNKLKIMQRNAIRLQNQVNQLLDLNKSDVNKLHLNMMESDVIAFINSICSSFTLLSEKEKIAFTFSSGIPSLQMSFDKDKLGKVMMNLLSNAFKFTDADGKVNVSMNLIHEKGLPDLLEIKVSDTGIGIKDEDKEKIFERFYQVDRSEVKTSGSGVGLSFVRDYVTLHGGTVKVSDNSPVGSVFVIQLPLQTPKSRPLEEKDEDEVVVVRTQKGNIPQSANSVITIEKILEQKKDEEIVGNENINTVSTIKAQKATVIQLTEEEEDQIITRVIPADELPEIVTTVEQEGIKDNRLSTVTPKISNKYKSDVRITENKRPISHFEEDESEGTITMMDEKLVETATKYVEANISRSDFSVEELSKKLGISRVYLYKKLLAVTGKTPVEFIRSIRLRHAALLLRETHQNVSDVANLVGINNPKYFSRYFRDEFGVLPSVYQEQHGN